MHQFYIFYQNARGLRTKVALFYNAASLSAYDVVILTESCLSGGILDNKLFPQDYCGVCMF